MAKPYGVTQLLIISSDRFVIDLGVETKCTFATRRYTEC